MQRPNISKKIIKGLFGTNRGLLHTFHDSVADLREHSDRKPLMALQEAYNVLNATELFRHIIGSRKLRNCGVCFSDDELRNPYEVFLRTFDYGAEEAGRCLRFIGDAIRENYEAINPFTDDSLVRRFNSLDESVVSGLIGFVEITPFKYISEKQRDWKARARERASASGMHVRGKKLMDGYDHNIERTATWLPSSFRTKAKSPDQSERKRAKMDEKRIDYMVNSLSSFPTEYGEIDLAMKTEKGEQSKLF
jgi:hypothetical protein